MGSEMDTVTDLGHCVDSISDLSHFILVLGLVHLVPMLSLTFLCHMRFVFSRYISL